MLSDIISQAVAAEPDMVIISDLADQTTELASFSLQHQVDVIILDSGEEHFSEQEIDRLLQINPRLGVIAIEGACDRGVLQRLVPSREPFSPLTKSGVIEAIRAGASLRRL